MHKYIRRTVYPVLTLALLLLAALALASTAWFHRMVQRRVTAELQRLTGARVEIGRMTFSLFTLQITLDHVVLHGSEEAPDPPLFSAQTLAFRLRPSSVFSQPMKLTALDLNGAEVHLLVRRDGSSNIPGPALPTAMGTLQPVDDFLELAIRHMTVNHTNVYWNNARSAVDLEAENVAIQMRRDRALTYQGSLSSTALRFKMPRLVLPPTTVTSRFEISRAGLEVTALNWRATGFNGESTLKIKASPNFEAEALFHATGAAAQLGKMAGLGSLEGGEVNVSGQAAYAQGAWNAQGRVEGHQILARSRSFDPGRVDFGADFTVTEKGLQFPKLQIAALGGTLNGKGAVGFQPAPPRYSLQGEVRGARLSSLLASLSHSHPFLNTLRWSSSVQGTVDAAWTGHGDDLNSRFVLQFKSPPGAPGPGLPVNGSISAVLTNSRGPRLEIEALNAQSPQSSLQLHGTVQEGQSQLVVELRTTDFEEWRSPVQFLARTGQPIPLVLRDQVTFSGSVDESPGAPRVRGQLATGKLEFRGWSWDGLAADVSVSPGLVQVSGGRLRSGQSMLTVNAVATLENWQLDPNGPARFDVRAEKTPLAGLKAALGAHYPVDGLATGQIELAGTPSKVAGSGVLQIDQGTLAGRSFDKLSATFRVADSVWNVESFEIERGRSTLSGKGSFDPATRTFSATLRGQEVSLSDLSEAGSARVKSGGTPPFDGVANFSLEGNGTPENVALRAQWSVQDAKVMGMPAGSLEGQLDWHDNQLHATGQSAGAGGTLHFTAQAQTEGDWPTELTGEYSDFRFGPWIRLLLNRKFDSDVTGTGTVKVSGPLRRPAELTVESRVQTLRVNASDLAWTNVQPVNLRFQGSNLSISRFSIQGPSTNLEAEGTVRFGEQPSLALSARGESDAKLLSLLDPAVKATGISKVDLVVNGTPVHPLLFGKLEVQDLNLSYGDFPIRLYGMNGEIRLEGERATVQSLRGTSGGGSVAVQGYMSFGGTPVFEVTAKVDQVRLQYPTDFISQLAGTLRLSGTPDNSRVDGELVIRQLYTTPDFSVLGLLSTVGGAAGAPSIGAASPVASRVRLNVQVFSAPTVRLEAQDLRMVADVDLHLQGTLANPVGVGAIHILSGEAVMRGNRYTINRADISMTNPFRTQPVLDLEATTRVQRYDLTLDVSGALDRLKIGYRSDPPLPTADILSLLALGYSRQQGELSTTGQEHLSSVGASALLSEALSSQMTGRIQKLFGVSRIKIDPNVGGPENVAGARVTVEQQVTRELTLTYITDTGSSQRRVVQFEWQVSNVLSVFGVRDRNGIFGVELRFRRRFK